MSKYAKQKLVDGFIFWGCILLFWPLLIYLWIAARGQGLIRRLR